MKIRMKIAVAGTFHGRSNGVSIGDVIEVDDVSGARYCELHYAEPVAERKEERAVKTEVVEERAQPAPEPKAPVEQPKAPAEEAAPRPNPRRQR
ncbi:hypothetical protein E2F47_22225 [Mycobacterium eburneum]|nr:hypothetical protein [Mycobacterium eburneum]TDH48885.1 hypothetical protein E2F47_22225 [Mycobacterium eburneum]